MKIEKWSIYRANLNSVIGSEQGKSRPVLVVSEDQINDLLNTVNVIPITSRKTGRKIYPNESLISANNFGLKMNLLFFVIKSEQLINKDFQKNTDIF